MGDKIVHHRGLQVADLRGSVLRCPEEKSCECTGHSRTERMACASRLLPRFCPGRTCHVGRSSRHAANHPFFGCCITNKKGNVNHCDVTKAYFGILTANRWKATYQNVHPDHLNTQHQHWANSGGSGASTPSGALGGPEVTAGGCRRLAEFWLLPRRQAL